jgi:hypothetical protein
VSDLGSTVPVREGLPANYRMRADAHYVDQLEMRRVSSEDARPLPASAQVSAPPAQLSRLDQPALNEGDLAKSLASVLSCTDLINEGMPQLTRTVAVDMIRAETQRVICALRTAAVLRQGVAEERRIVMPRAVVDRIADLIGADARLRGSRLAKAVAVTDDITLRINEDAMVTGLSAVALMMSAGLNNIHGAQLDVEVASTSSDRVSITVRQESVILPEACLKAASGRGEQANHPAVAPLIALRQIAESHGGSLAITRLPHGTQVAVDVPAASAHA